jgi:hypothetical protein
MRPNPFTYNALESKPELLLKLPLNPVSVPIPDRAFALTATYDPSGLLARPTSNDRSLLRSFLFSRGKTQFQDRREILLGLVKEQRVARNVLVLQFALHIEATP